jgi:hypothetical protein
VTSDVIMVMRTTLSKKEFASALGMNEKDVFVMKMFNIVDRDGDGRISFQEFLDTIVLFSKVNKHKRKTFHSKLIENGFVSSFSTCNVQFFGEFQQIYFSNKMIKKPYNKARK